MNTTSVLWREMRDHSTGAVFLSVLSWPVTNVTIELRRRSVKGIPA